MVENESSLLLVDVPVGGRLKRGKLARITTARKLPARNILEEGGLTATKSLIQLTAEMMFTLPNFSRWMIGAGGLLIKQDLFRHKVYTLKGGTLGSMQVYWLTRIVWLAGIISLWNSGYGGFAPYWQIANLQIREQLNVDGSIFVKAWRCSTHTLCSPRRALWPASGWRPTGTRSSPRHMSLRPTLRTASRTFSNPRFLLCKLDH